MRALLGLPRSTGSLVVIPRLCQRLTSPLAKTVTAKTTTESGFTLVEILVVVVILSIFAGMMSLSVGSSESRKNRAFYEHLIDSMQYVRLLSAERMQPMGLSLKANSQGQLAPVIVTLSDPYNAYRQQQLTTKDAAAKNAMELSALSQDEQDSPSWQTEAAVTLPELPDRVSITIHPLDEGQTVNSRGQSRVVQPWFVGEAVPQVIWFGTGEATPVTIEITHDARPVGEVIIVEPNGNVKIGQAS
ncbi:prepilin-type N-terminal cleavage/methylation domain-containing protein [Psychrobacter pygoscelis]|uniref:prepilin-type N-terminal cleavage/methylation domain-containing protein n=1 Tax=Psychrobacter pygoscelis TaxID=2488563 RepID=UPI00103AAE6B|nr:prepilin-type N-terminal cleavage/methylation domain-containing protein [Psychrobacter pygoscelis]